jgi:hypothetical protein
VTVTNQTHHFWRTTLERGLPFLKVELLRDNPLGVDLDGWQDMVVGGCDAATISSAPRTGAPMSAGGPRADRTAPPRVHVVLATHEPREDWLRAQVASILAQQDVDLSLHRDRRRERTRDARPARCPVR